MQPCFPGFEQVNRYWDKHRQCFVAKILPGEFYVTRHSELIGTVLGSCVSACIRDKLLGLGGVNHFMLPQNNRGTTDLDGSAARYGCFAMEQMINAILKFGGNRKRLEAKLVGGGKIITSMGDVGRQNIEFARNYLAVEGIATLAEDLGGDRPRKLLYNPITGVLKVKKLNSFHNNTLVDREVHYRDQLQEQSLESDVELF
ncbi:chemotaxis protein CheD [Motiliproteus sp. MSK22-1]|nr:chemotaxis protein CheD [Motiliproteus sp. MSK22-1]